MGVIGEICQKITALLPPQIEVLERFENLLQFASDVAHAQVTVYTLAHTEGYLAIVGQASPNTTFIQYKPNLLGATIQAVEEPLVWRTLASGQHISGQREWALGMLIEMQTYPVVDTGGQIIAAISFEMGTEEAREGGGILIETAYMLLTETVRVANGALMRPLAAHDGILIADEQRTVVFANAAAIGTYRMMGVGRIVGRTIYDRQMNLRSMQKNINANRAVETEIESDSLTLLYRIIPLYHGKSLLRVIIIVSDVTEIKKKEKELLVKSAVIQEIHHRVKNNLQTIASLLRLQARRTKSPEVKAALRESVNRILSISVVHEFLSQQDEEFIDVAEVAKNILDLVIQSMMEPDFNIQTIFNSKKMVLPSDQAMNLALAINELIQNSIEHGFVGRRDGIIGIDIRALQDSYIIEIYDNGIGLPEKFSLDSSNSLGLQIIRTLIETDLGGSFHLISDQGTRARITIPRVTEGR